MSVLILPTLQPSPPHVEPKMAAVLSSEITVKQVFFLACWENDCQKVQHIFPLSGDVNWRDYNDGGWSGLHIAALGNYRELLELLLAQPGVDVNIRDNDNRTPLMFACGLEHENIMRRLCQVTGIHLNSRDDDGRTALYYAVANNKPACVSVLREVVGVDWNVRTDGGWYPLTLAVVLGYADILQTILSVPEPHLDLGVTHLGRNISQLAVEGNPDYGDRQRCLKFLSGDQQASQY